MNNKFSVIIIVALLTGLASCMNSYNIEGSAEHPGLDNSIVYLKIFKKDYLKNADYAEMMYGDFLQYLKNVDSTEVVHGKFGLSGTIDSTRIAYLAFDQFLMPLVLEDGTIKIMMNKDGQKWGGTELNDRLFQFNSKYDSLQIKLDDLDHEYTLAFMDGLEDMQNDVIPRLRKQNQMIFASIDSLFTQTVVENYDNVIAPYIFMTYAKMQRYPEMTPWVLDIMSKATEKFKKDPFVVFYVDKAKQIQNQANGLEQPASVATPQPPTPNEMAASSGKEDGDTTKVTKEKK